MHSFKGIVVKKAHSFIFSCFKICFHLFLYRDDKDSEKNVYFPCYTRMGPYIIGLITGYLLYKTKCKCKMPKVSH